MIDFNPESGDQVRDLWRGRGQVLEVHISEALIQFVHQTGGNSKLEWRPFRLLSLVSGAELLAELLAEQEIYK